MAWAKRNSNKEQEKFWPLFSSVAENIERMILLYKSENCENLFKNAEMIYNVLENG